MRFYWLAPISRLPVTTGSGMSLFTSPNLPQARRISWCLAHMLILLGACSGGKVGQDQLREGDGQVANAGEDAGPGAGTPAAASLYLQPAESTLLVPARDMPAKVALQAFLSTEIQALSGVKWRVSGDLVDIDDTGLVLTRGFTAGDVEVTAYYGKLRATAKVHVQVALSEQIGTVTPENLGPLGGPPEADPGLLAVPANPTKILYPYDETVMPKGLSAPTLQLSPGSLPPADMKVTLRTEGFVWEGFVHVDNPKTPQLSIPQDVWDAALATAKGGVVTIEVVKAAGGKAYGPASIAITAADATLKGAVYYMTYEGSALGVWSTRPGVQEPPKHIIKGCTVCHSASANGTRLSTGSEGTGGGVYNIGPDGGATQLTGAPSGFGGDSRGLSYATFTPDGRYVMRSKNNFWGGMNQLAWRIDDAKKALIDATVVGLGAGVSAYLPAFSHDGKRYAFTNGAGEASPPGSVGRSLSIMDVNIDESAGAGGTLTFSNRQTLIDNKASGSVAKFVTFLPDSKQLVFQQGKGYAGGYGEMLPTWGSNNSYTTSTGRLAMVHADGGGYVELARLNAGNAAIDADRNYEPFSLPVSAGGYFWVVFTSIRDYGNTYTGARARKQLWVAAISPKAAVGQDPSHPAFYLPNQGPTKNERGFWALERCRANGSSCDTGDECCGGFCRPGDPADPSSARVCTPPGEVSCAELHERCESAADCCRASGGAECIGGFCDVPPPESCRKAGQTCSAAPDCCGGLLCEGNVCIIPIQ